MYLWGTKGPAVAPHGSKAPSVQWASFHHDDMNTGNFGTPLPFVIAGPPKPDDSCGCSSDAAQFQSQAVMVSLIGATLLLGRRARRRRS